MYRTIIYVYTYRCTHIYVVILFKGNNFTIERQGEHREREREREAYAYMHTQSPISPESLSIEPSSLAYFQETKP